MGANMEITGMNELVAHLQMLGAKAARIENEALRSGGEVVAEAMRNHVNVSGKDQKHIRDDIQVSNVKNKDGMKHVEVGPGKETNWRAKFLEFGTSKMSARPFMGPAAAETKGEVVDKMKEVIKGGLGI
jgi:HK97 gp10 family phage protein